MGRYYWDKKNTVEDCTCLSIVKLKEFGLLGGCCSTTLTWTRSLSGHKSSIGIVVDVLSEPYVKLSYTVTDRSSGEKTDYDYKVQLTTTPCNFGGVRYWFICPLSRNGVYCGRRVAKLYCAPGRNYYGCRHCHNLSYESRNECRHGIFGIFGGVLNIDKRIEKLSNQTKRWTYGGRLTRKARRIHALQQRMEAYDRIWRMGGF